MNRGIRSLLLILLIQSAMVAAVYWPQDKAESEPTPPLLSWDIDQVEELHVGDAFDNETVLRKTGSSWTLPELDNLPADADRVDRLLEVLANAGKNWPAADSIAARQRFRVASYHYGRRVRLLGPGEQVETIYLGVSPGFKKIYVRNAQQRAIYSIPFSAHEAAGHSGGWLDRRLLQVRTPLRIDADSYSLQRDGRGWRSGIGYAPHENELQSLLGTLRSLQITGLANADTQRELSDAEADLLFDIEALGGEVTLELFRLGDRHYIHSSEYPLFFSINEYDYFRLASVDLARISGDPVSSLPTDTGDTPNTSQ